MNTNKRRNQQLLTDPELAEGRLQLEISRDGSSCVHVGALIYKGLSCVEIPDADIQKMTVHGVVVTGQVALSGETSLDDYRVRAHLVLPIASLSDAKLQGKD